MTSPPLAAASRRPAPLRGRAPRLAAALGLAALLAACTDRGSPVGPEPPTPPTGPPGTPVTVQALTCTGDLPGRTVSCAPAAPEGGASGDIIVGSQNVYVKLTSSNVAYNGGTGQFTFDVTVQNLIEQPMGTADGVSLDPNGIRIFFNSGPTATGGTGAPSVVPDGFATFLAAGQPYYQYNQILAQNATSTARTWTLVVPPTVTTFDFVLYVSAPVPYPDGYITLNGNLPGASYGLLHPASTVPLTAVVKTAVGAVVPGATVTFGTSNADCAGVDPGGTVTGVRAATCSITASSTVGANPVNGSLSFEVTGTQRSWTGAVSTDWFVGGNWAGGYVPAPVDSAVIASVPNQPALSAAVAIGGLEVQNAATVSLGAFDLTATANVATAGTGAINATTGRLVLSGTGTIAGTLPRIFITGAYSVAGTVNATAPAEVENGSLTDESNLFQVN